MWILYVSFVGHAIQAGKNALNVELQDDPDLLSDVLSALSKRIQSGMNLYRSNILGKVPKDRDEFEPRKLQERFKTIFNFLK